MKKNNISNASAYDYDKISKISFSDLLRNLRKERGLTQKQIADMLNIERSTYTYYETGRTFPSFPTLIKIANCLNISAELFINAEAQNVKALSDSKSKFHDNTNDEKGNGEIAFLDKEESRIIALYRLLSVPDKKAFLNDLKHRYNKISF